MKIFLSFFTKFDVHQMLPNVMLETEKFQLMPT